MWKLLQNPSDKGHFSISTCHDKQHKENAATQDATEFRAWRGNFRAVYIETFTSGLADIEPLLNASFNPLGRSPFLSTFHIDSPWCRLFDRAGLFPSVSCSEKEIRLASENRRKSAFVGFLLRKTGG